MRIVTNVNKLITDVTLRYQNLMYVKDKITAR